MSTGKTPRKRRPKPGDIAALRRTLWACLLDVEAIVNDPNEDTDTRLRAVHGLSALAGQYLKATDAHELEARITALETAVQQQPEVQPWRAA